jgi:hypothetical protein
VNMAMNFRVPQNVMKFLSNYTTGGFSRRAQLHVVRQLYVSPTNIFRAISQVSNSFRMADLTVSICIMSLIH